MLATVADPVLFNAAAAMSVVGDNDGEEAKEFNVVVDDPIRRRLDNREWEEEGDERTRCCCCCSVDNVEGGRGQDP